MTPVIEVAGLSKRYGGQAVVRDISFQVDQGEIFGILGLISRGCSNREAAARLFISEATVKTHVLHIYAKLGVNDRAAAVATGFERGLLPRP